MTLSVSVCLSVCLSRSLYLSVFVSICDSLCVSLSLSLPVSLSLSYLALAQVQVRLRVFDKIPEVAPDAEVHYYETKVLVLEAAD